VVHAEVHAEPGPHLRRFPPGRSKAVGDLQGRLMPGLQINQGRNPARDLGDAEIEVQLVL
jgi:hypothetical protein